MLLPIIFGINFLVAVASFFTFYSVEISPEKFWIAGFVSWLTPSLLLLNVLFLIFWLLVKPLRMVLSGAVLVLGFKFVQSTFSLSIAHDPDPQSIKVLSYNVRVFNIYANARSNEYSSSEKMLEWIINQDADIMCFQEFYNERKSTQYNTVSQLSQKGKYKWFFEPFFTNAVNGKFGMAIFSKYPIVGKGMIDLGKTNNQAIYVDIKIKGKIIRIYDFHLHSMSLDEDELVKTIKGEGTEFEKLNIINRLKNGFVQKARQVKQVDAHIKDCPYPVIACGDLNDTPYSFCYEVLTDRLKNSFEAAGNGFGFTFNGKVPFLRLDHQFASDGIKARKFITYKDVPYSDHFPIFGVYNIDQ
jgi:endonuclease/exonuclease/phosphatase family metal-dependent hydrolase